MWIQLWFTKLFLYAKCRRSMGSLPGPLILFPGAAECVSIPKTHTSPTNRIVPGGTQTLASQSTGCLAHTSWNPNIDSIINILIPGYARKRVRLQIITPSRFENIRINRSVHQWARTRVYGHPLRIQNYENRKHKVSTRSPHLGVCIRLLGKFGGKRLPIKVHLRTRHAVGSP